MPPRKSSVEKRLQDEKRREHTHSNGLLMKHRRLVCVGSFWSRFKKSTLLCDRAIFVCLGDAFVYGRQKCWKKQEKENLLDVSRLGYSRFSLSFHTVSL
jgi:hypothetical protein